ncbi:MAG: hypothetical protein ACOCT0_01825 [Halobacteriota archaeon]
MIGDVIPADADSPVDSPEKVAYALAAAVVVAVWIGAVLLAS